MRLKHQTSVMDYKAITLQTIVAAKQAAQFIKGEKDKITADSIETKGLHDHVTYVDKTAETMLVKSLAEILPEAGFIVEENTSDKVGDLYDWIVDPLDGTSNYIHGFGPFAVSIALIKNRKELVVGVVHEIMANETFYAWQGGGAFCNDKPIRTSSTTQLGNAMIATGFPYNEFSKLENHVQTLAYFLRNARGIRRLGSAATDICYVACGRFDAFWEYNLSPWDCAAGALVLIEAGGKVSDFSGGDNYIFGQEIMCASPGVSNNFFEVVTGFLSN